jgi:hypothetical protein
MMRSGGKSPFASKPPIMAVPIAPAPMKQIVEFSKSVCVIMP